MKSVILLANKKWYEVMAKEWMKFQDSPHSVQIFLLSEGALSAALGKAIKEADRLLIGAESSAIPHDLIYLLNHRRQQGLKVIYLQGQAPAELQVDDDAEAKRLAAYYRYNGQRNRESLLQILSGDLPFEQWPEIDIVPLYGVYKNQKKYFTWGDYLAAEAVADKRSVNILLLFHREQWLYGNTAHIDAFLAECERQGCRGIALFCQFGANRELGYGGVAEVFREVVAQPELPIGAVITLQQQSMTGMPGFELDVVKRAGVPVLQAYSLYQEVACWEGSTLGLGTTELGTQVLVTEQDGILHTQPISGKSASDVHSYEPIPERIQMTVAKAKNWAMLRTLSNSEKKVAIILHNYPPRNSNIGSAAGVDTPESLLALLRELRNEGYTVGDLPADSPGLMAMILAQATNDSAFLQEKQIASAPGLQAESYRDFYHVLPEKTQEEMATHWGTAPGEKLVFGDKVLAPGIVLGNIFVGIQPSRGFAEDTSAIYHSPTLPPSHQYLAFYEWIRREWKASAVVHLGTHGSLEWLPGKGTGLSASCYPDAALRELPDIYPYWVTIVGEGIQAKRRGSACLIGHMSPPQEQAGEFGDYAVLRRLLTEYGETRRLGQSTQSLCEEIGTVAGRLAWDEPVADTERAWDDYAAVLHDRLDDLLYLEVRTGLHVLGKAPGTEAMRTYVAMLTEMSQGERKSLPEILAQANFPEDLTPREKKKKIYAWKDAILDIGIESDFSYTQTQWQHELQKMGIDSEITEEVWELAAHLRDVIIPALRQIPNEIANTITALSGIYIEPSLGGAPTSGAADILPTGRNFTSLDPRTFPTENAYRIGQIMAEQAIEKYVQTEGEYPESIGIVLWATAQMRSYGQCLGEIFALLGVRPLRQGESGQITGLEVIPLEELQRPRIDVVARISGLFRDTMPTAAAWVDQAVRLVAELPESVHMNYVRKHVEEDLAWAREKGEEISFVEACWRVFGDPPGAYGAGVGAALETRAWQNKADLAEVYLQWSGYAFVENEEAVDARHLFPRRLQTVAMTIQNADNRESHLLNSDDYNAYHGGMNAAVETFRGNKPLAILADTSRRREVVTRTIAEETERLVRGEALNPKYIEGMQRHGYKGAQELANYVAHMYQWDATSDVASDWMYDQLFNTYVVDSKMQAWFNKVNPWALQRLAETFWEASARNLWAASDEQKELLTEILLRTEGELEDYHEEDGGER